ncbi:cycloisomaltooligosaccharide glucanotransferase [Bacteroidia bacterium]|nr:cycloisomaltooligosaccharide glucanotransferase [Bacteroidia bacterium]
MKKIILFLFITGCLAACSENSTEDNSEIVKFPVPDGVLSTDKARYAPDETVTFFIDRTIPAGSKVRYRHLSTIVAEEPVSDKSWTWTPPATDFRGYSAEVYSIFEGKENIIASTGIDVSSNWTRFPRYGFLSSYNAKTETEINTVIDNLNRFHINGLQYYDWLFDHHKPLAGTPSSPASSWPDLINRTNTRTTTDAYIAAAKKHNIASMWYDLCYGALSNAAADGVQESWYLFTDAAHTQKDAHVLNSPFRSSIYLINPNNQDWLNYFSARVKEVYDVYGFDGFHIDQLGSRGTRYDSNGAQVNLPDGFEKFIRKMKTDFPQKAHAFNAVSGYGQQKIASAGVDFMYNEIWGERPNYADLKTLIDENHSCNNNLNCVFAAYMNYDLGKQKGVFNPSGVLMTDAVMFAVGASHIELGEHMLCNEYFPNTNLTVDNALKKALLRYYDFLVIYQNILRDGGSFNTVDIATVGNTPSIAPWPPATGKITSLSKKVGDRQIVHLFNFVNAQHLQWRDLNGTQTEPRLQQKLPLQITVSQTVKKIWVATPDKEGRMFEEVEYTQNAGVVNFTLPALKYWTMIVIE